MYNAFIAAVSNGFTASAYICTYAFMNMYIHIIITL